MKNASFFIQKLLIFQCNLFPLIALYLLVINDHIDPKLCNEHIRLKLTKTHATDCLAILIYYHHQVTLLARISLALSLSLSLSLAHSLSISICPYHRSLPSGLLD